MNQEELTYLRSFISFAQFDRSSLLPSAQLAINKLEFSSSGVSPFFLTRRYCSEPVQQYNTLLDSMRSNQVKLTTKFLV